MIKIVLRGAEKLIKSSQKMAQLKQRIPGEVLRIANRFGERTVRTSKQEYLSGPRPEKLGVVTGYLRSNIRYRTTSGDNKTVITVGTQVPYAAIHEKGGAQTRISSKGKSFTVKMRKRPFLEPAIRDNLPSLKDDLNKIFSTLYGK